MVYQIHGIVFVHGGVLPDHVTYSIERINQETRAWLLGEGTLPDGIVGSGNSVDWDRTYSDNGVDITEESCQILDSVLEQLQAKQMIVGHSVYYMVNSACDQKVWRIDTGMSAYYGGTVQVLEITNDEFNILNY